MKRLALLFSVLCIVNTCLADTPVVSSDDDTSLTWKDTLSGAANKVVTLCNSLSMQVTSQTTNAITCRIDVLSSTIFLNFTLIRTAHGVRVSWREGALMTDEQARNMTENPALDKALRVGLTQIVTTGRIN